MTFNKKVLRTIFVGVVVVLVFTLIIELYFLGLVHGYRIGRNEKLYLASLETASEPIGTTTPTSTPTPTTIEVQLPTHGPVSWGGPELWEAVNKRRGELGVNPLSQRDELCTIASIRLNQLLELGKLDGHKGFSNLKEERPDLEWIFESYSTLAEFLAVGGQTPEETVSLWENTLGHKRLLDGGEYVWGCIYAQNSFAVAITAF